MQNVTELHYGEDEDIYEKFIQEKIKLFKSIAISNLAARFAVDFCKSLIKNGIPESDAKFISSQFLEIIEKQVGRCLE